MREFPKYLKKKLHYRAVKEKIKPLTLYYFTYTENMLIIKVVREVATCADVNKK
jgi:hypothetical protein